MRPRMMRVVAQNLAENAIRYAGPGRHASRWRSSGTGDTVVLRGTDDGAGVEEAQLTRLFERFFRADRARASRGTGLGLAIVKHVVTQAGGSVEARGGQGGRARDPLRLPSRIAADVHRFSPDLHPRVRTLATRTRETLLSDVRLGSCGGMTEGQSRGSGVSRDLHHP